MHAKGLATVLFTLMACTRTGADVPSERQARQMVEVDLAKPPDGTYFGRPWALRTLDSFRKVDGTLGDIFGVKTYVLECQAELKVVSSGKLVGGPGPSDVHAGDRVVQNCTVTFVRKESGWVLGQALHSADVGWDSVVALDSSRRTTTSGPTSGIAGSWYDGGPNCAKITQVTPDPSFRLRLWYCGVGEENAAELSIKEKDGGYADESGAVFIRQESATSIRIELRSPVRDRLGNLYSTDTWRPTFGRQ